MNPLNLHPERLFPADATTRDIARTLYAQVTDLPIISRTVPPARRNRPVGQASRLSWSRDPLSAAYG